MKLTQLLGEANQTTDEEHDHQGYSDPRWQTQFKIGIPFPLS